MSTDVLKDTPRQAPPRQCGDDQGSSPRRWWKRVLLAVGGIAAAASAAALIADSSSSREIGPKLTHTIARGDLIVTVTERGILESSENTEIKCGVRGQSAVIWVIDGGTVVEAGDELVRLDTLAIETAFNERSKYAHWSRSAAERSRATVAAAKLAIPQYLEGTYRADLMTKEKDLAIAKSNLRTAQSFLAHSEMMAERGYVSDLFVEQRTIAVARAELSLEVLETQIRVLKDYDRQMQLETLQGNLKAAKATLDADEERAKVDAARRDLAADELELCVIRAEKSGMVIHPSAAKWETGPKIEVGGTVHKDQVLLLMPDLSKMQVKLGVREAVVDRITPGLAAKVTLPDKTLQGEVFSVASVTGPPSIWTGEVVKYDTVVTLPPVDGLKPGMSADVEVIVARHEDVLMIPVAAVAETDEGDFCWVRSPEGIRRRSLRLGDSNDVFTIVKAGLKEGDQVVLDTSAFIDASKLAGSKSRGKTKTAQREPTEPSRKAKPQEPDAAKEAGDSDRRGKKPQDPKTSQGKPRPSLTGAQIVKHADKNGDGVLTVDEIPEKQRGTFGLADTNQDGSLDASELDAAMKKRKDAKAK